MQVLQVEDSLGQPPEKARLSPLEHRTTRTEQCGAGQQCLPEGEEVILVTTGAVQQQERWKLSAARLESMDQLQGISHGSPRHRSRAMAAPRTISSRCASSHAGSLREVPSSASGSSQRKPGVSVATSKSTPPGSRKYTDLKYCRSTTGVIWSPDCHGRSAHVELPRIVSRAEGDVMYRADTTHAAPESVGTAEVDHAPER